jgi:hypothetical protein
MRRVPFGVCGPGVAEIDQIAVVRIKVNSMLATGLAAPPCSSNLEKAA